jgi:hypothetical protein
MFVNCQPGRHRVVIRGARLGLGSPWCVSHRGGAALCMAAPPIKAGPARDGTGSRCGTGTRPSRPARGRGFPQRRIVGASLTRNSTVRNPSHPDRFALVGVCKHPMRMLRGSLGPLPPRRPQSWRVENNTPRWAFGAASLRRSGPLARNLLMLSDVAFRPHSATHWASAPLPPSIP